MLKKILVFFSVCAILAPSVSFSASPLATRLKGYVLLRVHAHGEAYYVNPTDGLAYYLANGAAAYQIMRNLGLGVSEKDYANFAAGNASLRNALRGRIALRVHAHGEAYYLCPRTGQTSYLKDGNAAFTIMRECGLGISEADFATLPLAPSEGSAPAVTPPVPSPAPTPVTTAGSPTISGCAIFPSDNPWNQEVSGLPVNANSSAYINSIGASRGLHADFGETVSYGIPYNIADNSTPKYSVTFDYDDESDHALYPIPDDVKMEGPSDAHILVIQKDECKLYELFAAEKTSGGWHAGSGAIWDLTSNALRPEGWTSADAAGLPIFPGLVRYDEVAAGVINHAIRFTAPSTQRAYIHPATHYASSSTNPSLPPMGLRVRLKADYDISDLPPQAKVIATAMKKYGMILADNGSSWFFQGAWDAGWNDDDLNTLKGIPGSAFEALETGGLIK